MASRLVRWGLVGAVAAAILYASIAAPPWTPAEPAVSDKAYHGGAYGVLALSIAFATLGSASSRITRALFALTFCVGYGALLEAIQGPLPSRSFELLDIAADAIGALVVIPWMLLERRFARH